MKKEHILALAGAFIILGSANAYAYTAGKDSVYRSAMRGGVEQGEYAFMGGGYRQLNTDTQNSEFTHRLSVPTDTSALSDVETAGLVKMREEEKLARDVYLTLGEKWNVPVFKNIASSEQRHTEAVKSLLVTHGVGDPVSNDVRGVFQNQDLAKLYTDLVARGSESVGEAYRVGAYIEDLDIADLEKEIKGTTHEDIQYVYENLKLGSENHMRAFNRNIEIATEKSYVPSFISKDAFELIVSEENGMGMGMRMGQGGREHGSGMGLHDGGGRGRGMGR